MLAALLSALLTGLAQGQSAPAPVPAWVQRFVQSERAGQFGHAWLSRAASITTARQQATASALAVPHFPGQYDLRGTFRAAVLAATYSDYTPSVTTGALDTLFFSATGKGSRYSLAQYYREVSGGRFTIAGAVTPWMKLPGTKASYGRQQTPFVRDILVRADSTVDWRLYDNDGPDGRPNSGDDDGYVDLAMLVHPMADGVCRTDALGGPIATGFRVSQTPAFNGTAFVTRRIGANGQPIKVDDYVITAALHCGGSGVASVNITAHEMGHALGLPDLYDLDHSSYGAGAWDLMGYGLYVADGQPGMMSAWTRNRLGWMDVTTVTSNRTLTIPAAETSRLAFRIDLPGTSEYLLLENRQRIGADSSLPGTGLLVWHIDERVLAGTLPKDGANENDARPGIALVQADGRMDLTARVNVGDAGDPFPGTAANRLATDATSPSVAGHGGVVSGIQLRNIAVSAGIVTVDVVLGATAPGPANVAFSSAMQHLLHGAGLTSAEKHQLDVQGNNDGVFNAGDVLAWMSRNGTLPTASSVRTSLRRAAR